MNWRSFGGNWAHVSSRSDRGKNKAAMDRCLHGLLRLMRERRLPNQSWYRPVRDGSEVIGYFCGQGCHISTFLSADMTPKGQKI